MKGVDTIARIRREFFIRGRSIKEIVRDLHVSRNTVRKVVRSGATALSYEREVQPLPSAAPIAELAPQRRGPPAPLPETVMQTAPRPGVLMVEAGQFAGRSAAEAAAARLPGARISQQGRGRSASFRVALGPFAEVRAADFALERTLAAGLSGARIIVE